MVPGAGVCCVLRCHHPEAVQVSKQPVVLTLVSLMVNTQAPLFVWPSARIKYITHISPHSQGVNYTNDSEE